VITPDSDARNPDEEAKFWVARQMQKPQRLPIALELQSSSARYGV
jgi:hypothetical protein